MAHKKPLDTILNVEEKSSSEESVFETEATLSEEVSPVEVLIEKISEEEVIKQKPKGILYCVLCISKTCTWQENKYVTNASEEKCPVCGGECGCTSPKPELMR